MHFGYNEERQLAMRKTTPNIKNDMSKLDYTRVAKDVKCPAGERGLGFG